MKFTKILILLSFIIFFNKSFSQNEIVGKVFTAYNGNVCKGKFTSYFYKQLEFVDKKTVKIVDYQKRNFHDVENVVDNQGKEYSYKIKNNRIAIIGTDLKEIKIDTDKLICNGLIFKIVKRK